MVRLAPKTRLNLLEHVPWLKSRLNVRISRWHAHAANAASKHASSQSAECAG